ncbi:MAG: hypothetical protein P8J27_06805 [Mariniblastus sp.]|nr:hypothetical protein [Mariniblastus sp.]
MNIPTPPTHPVVWLLSLSLLVGLIFQCGCSKEDMDKMASKVKDSASEFSEKSSEALEKAKKGAKDASAKIKEAASEFKDKTSETMSTLKDKATELASDAGNLVSLNGSAEITLDEPTKFSASYIRIIELNETTTVLQIKSYKDGITNSFPSFLLQGSVEGPIESLHGKTIPCQFYAQKAVDGDVWKNANGQLIPVQFAKLDDNMSASFANAMLVNTANGSQSAATAIFDCVVLE